METSVALAEHELPEARVHAQNTFETYDGLSNVVGSTTALGGQSRAMAACDRIDGAMPILRTALQLVDDSGATPVWLDLIAGHTVPRMAQLDAEVDDNR